MKLVKAGLLQRGNKVSINGALLEVQRIIPTAHKEPSVVIVFTNGKSYIAKTDEVLFVQIPEGGTSVNQYDGHQQQPIQQQNPGNFGQQQPMPQGNWQPGMQPIPPKQKKPFFKRTWVIVTGAVLLVFIVIGIANGGGSPTTDSAAEPSGGVTSSDKPVTSEKPQESTKPSQPAPAAKKFVKLVTLSGKADKQSDTIKTTGGKIRLSYTFTDPSNSGIIVAGIYFLKEGTDLQKDGGIPEVMISEPGKDTTTLRKDAGEYYLKVTSANAKYTVVVEEER
jgi:hypothetical protein